MNVEYIEGVVLVGL